jgi:hypothetical protein
VFETYTYKWSHKWGLDRQFRVRMEHLQRLGYTFLQQLIQAFAEAFELRCIGEMNIGETLRQKLRNFMIYDRRPRE